MHKLQAKRCPSTRPGPTPAWTWEQMDLALIPSSTNVTLCDLEHVTHLSGPLLPRLQNPGQQRVQRGAWPTADAPSLLVRGRLSLSSMPAPPGPGAATAGSTWDPGQTPRQPPVAPLLRQAPLRSPVWQGGRQPGCRIGACSAAGQPQRTRRDGDGGFPEELGVVRTHLTCQVGEVSKAQVSPGVCGQVPAPCLGGLGLALLGTQQGPSKLCVEAAGTAPPKLVWL